VPNPRRHRSRDNVYNGRQFESCAAGRLYCLPTKQLQTIYPTGHLQEGCPGAASSFALQSWLLCACPWWETHARLLAYDQTSLPGTHPYSLQRNSGNSVRRERYSKDMSLECRPECYESSEFIGQKREIALKVPLVRTSHRMSQIIHEWGITILLRID
jgi:hypothetical protein